MSAPGTQAAPLDGTAWFNRGIALKRARQWREAALAFRQASRLEPNDFESVQKLVETIATAVEEGDLSTRVAPPPSERTASGCRPISIVCCSIDPAREAAMRANYTAALEGREYEFIVIHDARSMAEGYTRGLAQARHPLVVFTHDDVELISECPFDVVDAALASHDLVGLAGSRRVAGPGVTWAGHPHLHGWIAYPSARHPGRWDATLFSTECGVLGGMQALDGVFIAARREAALAIGFDAATFDGFHFYDLDFTYRAHRTGLSLAVATGVVAVHASEGKFDEAWRACVPRFQAKFPELDAPAGAFHAYGAPLSSRARVLDFYASLRALGEAP